jgi:outer membrane protein assembly factor BamB
VVSDSLVFVTETKDEKYEVVRALQRATGKQVWETQWEGAMRVPFFARSNGDWIRSTPAYDGERLYVAGMRDVLVCLDATTGEKIWNLDFVKQVGTPLPSFGFVSSPLLADDYLFVQAAGSAVKLEKLTGEIAWRALQDGGGMYGSAFSSPVIAQLNGTEQLVVQTRSKLAGVDLVSGEELWSREIPAFRGMNILTPTLYGDSVLTSSYGGKTFLLGTHRDEAKFHVSEIWQNRVQGYMSSPVIIGDYAYLHLRNQRFTCLDLKSGETVWTTGAFGKYWSMVVAADLILALDERGELLLIKANPDEFTLIDRRTVSGNPTWAHLAVSGEELFIRDLSGLAVFVWKTPTEKPLAAVDRP